MAKELKSASERWIEQAGFSHLATTSSVFPRDATAVIYKPTRSAMTSGTARTKDWKLRFDRRSPQFIEPLMGWTGGDDTLTQVELAFPSAEAAVAYARRQGFNYVVQGDSGGLVVRPGSENAFARNTDKAEARSALRVPSVERKQTIRPKVVGDFGGKAGAPIDQPDHPTDILTAENLSLAQKRAILHQRAFNAYQVELARSRGERRSDPSALEKAIDALLALEEMEGYKLPHHFSDTNRDLRAA